MTASTATRFGKRVRPTLPAGLTASLRAGGVASFVDNAGATWEWSAFKQRYVRTVAGSKRYKLPIGAPIVAKPRKPGGGGKGGGAKPKPATPPPGGPDKPAPAGDRVKLTPAQRDAAERHLGTQPGAGRGAYLDGNRLVVEDRDAAVKALDDVLAGGDLTPGDRKARKNLRDKIAATGQGAPEQDPPGAPAQEPTPEPVSPQAPPPPAAPNEPTPESSPADERRLGHDELWADWLDNGPDLSEDELAVIEGYAQAGDHQDFNQLLRDAVDFPLSEEAEDRARQDIELLRGAMARYQMPGPASLYRRVSGRRLPPYPAEQGAVFTDKAFLSASTVPDPQNFADLPVVMQIDVPKGMDAINVYATGRGIGGEKEILLPPSTPLRIESDEMRDGVRWVRMTALPPL